MFIDETWASTKMTRICGRARKGERLRAAISHAHWKTTTFIAGLRSTGMTAPMVLDGPVNGIAFPAYVEQVLVPELKPGDVVIMDNLGSHKVPGVNRWHGDEQARRAVYNNRPRLRPGVAREAFKLRAERVERSFALTLDRGGLRRAWLRGRDNLRKRYLIHVAGYNLGLIMRLLVGTGTPRSSWPASRRILMLFATAAKTMVGILIVAAGTQAATLVITVEPEPHG